MKKNYNQLINQPKEEEIVHFNESFEYSYWSIISILLKTGGDPSNLKVFRFLSIGESAEWEKSFSKFDNSRKLFFYVMLDEIRSISKMIKEKQNMRFSSRNKENLKERYSFVLRCAIIGYLSTRILRVQFLNFLRNFGEGGDALRSLIILGSDFADSGRSLFFFSENTSPDEPMDMDNINKFLIGIHNLFNNSDFIVGYENFIQEAISLIEIIEREKTLSMFFSLYDGVQKSIIDHSKKNEIKKNIIIFDNFPLWLDISRDNSFFSFLFLPILDQKTQQYIRLLEIARIYMTMPVVETKKIETASFSYMMRILLDRKDESPFISDNDFKKYSEIFISGGDINEQKDFFSLKVNKEAIKSLHGVIEEIVGNEAAAIQQTIFEQYEDTLPPENEYYKLIQLFFLNIMSKIEKLLYEEGKLMYYNAPEEDMAKMSSDISDIIKKKIPDFILYGGE